MANKYQQTEIMRYHFWIGANPFFVVCPFDFYDIFNRHQLILGCVNGKKSLVPFRL